MKKVLVTMMAASMLVASMASAGIVNDSIAKSVSASKASTGFSTSVIEVSKSGVQIASRASIQTSQSLTGLSIAGINAVEGVSVSVINSSIGSTDIKMLQFSGEGIRAVIRLSAEVARLIPQGANLVLTRSAQGAYVLAIGAGTVVQDVLQLDLDDAIIGMVTTPVKVLRAMGTAHDETREVLRANGDK